MEKSQEKLFALLKGRIIMSSGCTLTIIVTYAAAKADVSMIYQILKKRIET